MQEDVAQPLPSYSEPFDLPHNDSSSVYMASEKQLSHAATYQPTFTINPIEELVNPWIPERTNEISETPDEVDYLKFLEEVSVLFE